MKVSKYLVKYSDLKYEVKTMCVVVLKVEWIKNQR